MLPTVWTSCRGDCQEPHGYALQSKKAVKDRLYASLHSYGSLKRVRVCQDHDSGCVIRRNLDDPTEVKYYLSNAPETIETARLARMCGMRWPIEVTFEVGKEELGMDQYETRSWV